MSFSCSCACLSGTQDSRARLTQGLGFRDGVLTVLFVGENTEHAESASGIRMENNPHVSLLILMALVEFGGGVG